MKSDIKKAYLLSDESSSELTVNRISEDDLIINVPLAAPDTMNTVVVLDINEPVEIDSVRLLAGKFDNTLLAFDSELHGDGFTYGDGKVNREYTAGWKSKEQWISWKFRLNESEKYEILLSYVTASETDSGSIVCEIDGKQYPVEYTAPQENAGNAKINIGSLELSKGEHTIKLLMNTHSGDECMRPLYVTMSLEK